MPRLHPRLHTLGHLIACTLLCGCEHLSYLHQAAKGQWEILHKREAIATLLAAKDTDPMLREKLTLVQDARAFARRELLLDSGNSYTSYTQLDRPYVVWNVVANAEFSMNPQRWCFPIAGCISYRGYFNEQDARHFANRLETQGFDTWVGGVEAYSTLGWFDDPVISTFTNRSEVSLAGLIFHELAHRTLYVTDDSSFNESFATAIEQEGIRRWLTRNGKSDRWDTYLRYDAYQQDFIALVQQQRAKREALYASKLSVDEMRSQKSLLVDDFRKQYRQLRDVKWQGYNAYDHWMSGSLNNAQLNTVSTYNAYVPALRNLMLQCSQSMRCFHARARELAKQDSTQRMQSLTALGEPSSTFRPQSSY